MPYSGSMQSKKEHNLEAARPSKYQYLFTNQQRIVLILISWKRTSTAHDTNPLRADREPSELSCHVIYIFLFTRTKDLFTIFLENASTGFKQCQIFTSLASGHFRGVIQYTNNVINLWHQLNTVLTACKYYSLISLTFCYKCAIFMEYKMPGSKPTANDRLLFTWLYRL